MDIKPDQGLVVTYQGEKVAVYKDASGSVTAVSAICPHQGCLVKWNRSDKTWDCPCHRSRFDKEGKVINGPAVTNLPKIEIDQ